MTGTVSGNTMLYILRCAKPLSNTNWPGARPQTHAPLFPIQETFTILVLLKVIKYFPSSTRCWTQSSLSFPTIPTTIWRRACSSERPLLCVAPAAGAGVTLCQGQKAWTLACLWRGSLPSHLSNGSVLYSVTMIPNVKPQGKIFSKYLVWKPLFLFPLSFPLSLRLKPENMGVA